MKYFIGFLLGFITMMIIVIKVCSKCLDLICKLELTDVFKEFLVTAFETLLYGPSRYRTRPRYDYKSYRRYRNEHTI